MSLDPSQSGGMPDNVAQSPLEPGPAASSPAAAAEPQPTPAEAIFRKLQGAPAPLKLAEIKKALVKPKKQSPVDFEAAVRTLLDDQVRAGQAFVHPSGKNGELRYGSKDEKHALAETALELAATPMALAELVKKMKPVSGADPSFIELVLRELIAQDKLFEHPPKKPNQPARFGAEKYRSPNDNATVTASLLAEAAPPKAKKAIVKAAAESTGADKSFVEALFDELVASRQLHEHRGKGKTPFYGSEAPKRIHPLETDKSKKALAKLAKDVRKLLDQAEAAFDDLLERLRPLLAADSGAEEPRTHHRGQAAAPTAPISAELPAGPAPTSSASAEKIEELILREVGNAPVLSLADLRRSMPAECRGAEFDAAAIRLFDQQKVVLYSDANPYRFSDAEKAEFVRDENGTLFTTISTRS